MKKEKISPPWYTIYKKIKAIFGRDPEITISNFNDDTCSFTMIIDSKSKKDAIEKLLKTEYNFGNVTLSIIIQCTCDDELNINYRTYRDAFNGNPILVNAFRGKSSPTTEADFIIFAKKVIQFYNDDISDYYGNYNGLPTEIAKEIFNQEENVNYSIDDDNAIQLNNN